MTIRNLDKAFHPASIAVIGASERRGAVGAYVIENIIGGGFEGPVWPVNPKYSQVRGLPCFASVPGLPHAPDLAVIATPSATVPTIIDDLARKGCRAAVVLSAGLTAENGLRQAMLNAARPSLFRIFGPNTLGLLLPHSKLNASFSHINVKPGSTALLSQSGAMITSIIDWAVDKEIGFSALVSLGDMADVDAGDCLDMLANDQRTQTILLYLESIPNPRKFISAARAAARLKPVIAIKAGRHERAAKAAATHTGALAGMDGAVDAALHRAGVLRVDDLEALFDAAEITSRFRPVGRARLAIVTNGGGAGVLAVDHLIDFGGTLAELAPETNVKLNEVLPSTWSHANPVDIIGDASPQRYRDTLTVVAADPGVDLILAMNCPTALASPVEAARTVAEMAQNGLIAEKPVLACWLGDHTARAARTVLQKSGIASFESPKDAVAAATFLADWSSAQAALSRVPEHRSEDVTGQRVAVAEIFAGAAGERRCLLTEVEAKSVLRAYCIPVPETVIAHDAGEVEKAAEALLKTHAQIAVKLYSKTVTHKSDIGGVVLGLSSALEAKAAAETITGRFAARFNGSRPEGFTVQPMIRRNNALETLVGMARDPVFGPVIVFGAGGTAVEIVNDTAMALPPLDDVLIGDLIGQTRIGRLLKGYRDVPAADISALTQAMNGVSQLIVDFPEILGLDINPLLADAQGVIALDARIELDLSRAGEKGPNRDLPVRPWPADWTRTFTAKDGRSFDIRPIRPADVHFYEELFNASTPQDIRFRFFSAKGDFDETQAKRLTQIDYEREMAFVALPAGEAKIAAVARLACDPDHVIAEFGILVRTSAQGIGLGQRLMELLIEYARSEKLERIEGLAMSDNVKMLALARKLGFSTHPLEDDRTSARLLLELAPA